MPGSDTVPQSLKQITLREAISFWILYRFESGYPDLLIEKRSNIRLIYTPKKLCTSICICSASGDVYFCNESSDVSWYHYQATVFLAFVWSVFHRKQ